MWLKLILIGLVVGLIIEYIKLKKKHLLSLYDVISIKQFEHYVGHKPTQIELDKVNCRLAGQYNHEWCGWCYKHNSPRFRCGCRSPEIKNKEYELLKELQQTCQIHSKELVIKIILQRLDDLGFTPHKDKMGYFFHKAEL